MKNEIALAGDSYTDNKIVSGTVVMVQSLDGNELQYDTLDATLDLGGFIPTLFKPADADALLTCDGEQLGVRPLIRILVADPTSYKYGAEVLYKHNGNLVGKYYMTSMKKVGKTQYQITCVSPVGLLANTKHYGGIYSGIAFSALIGEIIGGVVPFSVAPEIANQPVYGWLPVAPRRDNLHQALFVMGAAAQKDANGDLYITPLSDDLYTEIPDNRVYTGGSVSYPDTVTQVSISEHTYVANTEDERVTLHEGVVEGDQITTPGGVAATGTVILFTEPMHDLAVENGEIVESGVNYAVLSPAAECKLTGQKYTHTVREVTRPETPVAANAENKITVSDATLISIANSENVADRLMSYYTSAKTLSTDIAVDTERAGTAVLINDPFGDETKGIITSMDITMSNTLKARAEIVADYSPGNAGNFYSNVEVITESGTWVVPEGVEKIRVVVIGGGDGGEAGQAGTPGEDGTVYASISKLNQGRIYMGYPGSGGQGGNGGKSGKVTVGSVSVSPGDSISVTIGNGGAGAAYGEEPGTGENSMFGSLSSEAGYYPGSAGFASLFDGGVYAVPGQSGIAGGRGQAAGTSTSDAGEQPTVVSDDGIWIAGAYGGKAGGTITNPSYSVMVACGGTGGGAAFGKNGEDGAAAYFEKNTDGSGFAIGGKGGKGATPAKAITATIPGSGGQGGHGGGGGGGGGSFAGSVGAMGSGGNGGDGGEAGDGAPGCVLIYY